MALPRLFCPWRTAFYPRRDAKRHEEHLLSVENCFLSTEGHGGARRTPFCPRRTRRGAENCFSIHEGPRRDTKNTFCPWRTAFFHGGTRRDTENTFLSAEDAEGRGELLFLSAEGREETRRTPFVRGELLFSTEEHGGTRRTPFCPRRTRRGAENCFFVRGGRGGARRTAFFHEGPRRGHEEHLSDRRQRGLVHLTVGGALYLRIRSW